MSLQFTRPTFIECPTCRAKPGTPQLCRECLERRELHCVVEQIRGHTPFFSWTIARLVQICSYCDGTPNPDCPEHGR